MNRSPERSAAAGLLLAIGLTASGCGETPSGRPDLAPIAAPAGLAELDSKVKTQYAGYRSDLDRRLADRQGSNASLAEAYGRLGMWHHAYGLHAGAGACYRNALALAGEEFRWLYYLGLIHQELGPVDTARRVFERALAAKPDDVPTRVCLGEVEMSEERAARAAELFREALTREPNCGRARLGLGRALLASGQLEPALKELEAAAQQQPAAGDIQYALGLAYRDRGDIQKAKAHLARAQTDRGSGPRATMRDGLSAELTEMRFSLRSLSDEVKALLEAQQYDQALVLQRQLVERDPETPNWRLNLARTLMQIGQPQEALEQLDEVLRREPTNPSALFGRANLHHMRGDLTIAASDYQATLTANPDYMQAHFNLANVLRDLGRHQEASAHYARAVEIDPSNPHARYARALALVNAGQLVAARDALRADLQAIGLRPDLGLLSARLLATATDRKVRDGQAALQLANQLFAQQPNLLNGETVAMAYASLGDFERARQWQQACHATAEGAQQTAAGWTGRRLADYVARKPARTVWLDGERPTDIPMSPP